MYMPYYTVHAINTLCVASTPLVFICHSTLSTQLTHYVILHFLAVLAHVMMSLFLNYFLTSFTACYFRSKAYINQLYAIIHYTRN